MDESNILIIGSNGQLGTALKQKYPSAKAVDADDLDITSEDQIKSFDFTPFKVVINAAAYTHVDGAETNEGRVIAWQVNARAISLLANALSGKDVTFVHISTDYVFDGTKSNHKEDEPFSPLGVYGQSKAAGDLSALVLNKTYILRTSWVIGDGQNFVRTMLDIGQRGINPKVINDILGRPTFTSELVRAIDHLIKRGSDFGVYNVSNGGEPVSWAGLAKAVFDKAKISADVTGIADQEYYAGKTNVSRRPLNSVFDLSKIEATGFVTTDWHRDLEVYIDKELNK